MLFSNTYLTFPFDERLVTYRVIFLKSSKWCLDRILFLLILYSSSNSFNTKWETLSNHSVLFCTVQFSTKRSAGEVLATFPPCPSADSSFSFYRLYSLEDNPFLKSRFSSKTYFWEMFQSSGTTYEPENFMEDISLSVLPTIKIWDLYFIPIKKLCNIKIA